MIVSHLLLILHKKIQFYIFMFEALCLKPEMWQKVARFKGAESFARHCKCTCTVIVSEVR